jgi:thiol-disulfide isomerase/thioredoxin
VVAGGATLLAGLGACNSARAEGPDFQPFSAIAKVVPPAPAPDMALVGLDGSKAGLAAFRGRPLVLNFWATWCGPCVAELPELDKLAAGGRVGVVAVSADRGGAAMVAPFLKAHPLSHLTVLLDPKSEAVHAVGVVGFPTTLIIDAQGRVRGRLEGPAAWSGAADVVLGLTG